MSLTPIFEEYTLSGTQNKIWQKVMDQVLDDNVLTSRFLSKPKQFRGTQMDFGVRVGISNASAAQGGGFRGTDTFNTNVQNETQRLIFNPKYVYEPFNVVYTDLSQNTGKEEVYSIIQREKEYAMSNMLDNVGDMFYGSATESSKDFSGLSHIISSTGSYGGLARATYTVLKPGDTSGGGLDSSTTALTLAAMRTISNALTSGAVKPTMIVTTPAIFGYFEALLQPMQRMDIGGFAQVTRDGLAKNAASLGGATGFDALMYDGIPVVRDEKCTANAMYFLNENYLDFYRAPFANGFGWNEISLAPNVVEAQYAENMDMGHKTGFHWSGFKEPTNQAAANSQIVLAGELINSNPRRQGGFTAITS